MTDYSSKKRRSSVVTEGVQRTPNRAMLRAVGFGDDDFRKPIVGVANGYSTITPCNVGLNVLADRAADLAPSLLGLNLNPPNRIANTSWIRPMKYDGIWWGMHINTMTWKSGPLHGATTANAKRYIDFAAQNDLGGVLVEGRPGVVLPGGAEQVLVAVDVGKRRGRERPVAHDDERAHGVQLGREGLELRHEHVVHEQDEVGGVVDDVGDLLGEEPDVHGVQDGAARRDAEVQLQVTVRVPGERADAVAGLHAERSQRVPQAPGAPVHLRVRLALEPARRAADDLTIRKQSRRPLEQRADRQGDVHHQAAHGATA